MSGKGPCSSTRVSFAALSSHFAIFRITHSGLRAWKAMPNVLSLRSSTEANSTFVMLMSNSNTFFLRYGTSTSLPGQTMQDELSKCDSPKNHSPGL